MSALPVSSSTTTEIASLTELSKSSIPILPPDRDSSHSPSASIAKDKDVTELTSNSKGTPKCPKSKRTLANYQLISKYAHQDASIDADSTVFDRIITGDNGKICLLASKGLSVGNHQWEVLILKSHHDLQEIGISASDKLDNLAINDQGVSATPALKARATYGCDLSEGKVFYGSWNDNNTARCFRDLSHDHRIGWVAGDVLRVVINLSKWRIKFFLNGKAVKKVMSLQPHRTYHPVLCFSGNCRYKVY